MSRHSTLHLMISRLFPAMVTGAFAFILATHAAFAACGFACHSAVASRDYISIAHPER